MKSLLLGFLIITLIGCASYADKAKDHMEKENWEKAHEFWVLALKKDPADEEAIEGKRKTEYEITNKKLVQLRNLLGAGKSQQAVDLAWDLEKKHKEWGYTSSHAIGAFHGKQLKRLYPVFIKLLKTPAYTDYPIKSLILINRFEPVFAKMNQEHIQERKASAISSGKSYCNELRGTKGKKTPFYNDITERICGAFYKTKRAKSVKNTFLMGLNKKTNVRIFVGGLRRDYNDGLRASLSEELSKTPLIQRVGRKKLKIDVSGSISRETTSRVERRVKDYQVEEKYRAKEKIRENGKDVYKMVTKTREVTRYYRYNVTVSKRTYTVDLSAKFKALGQTRIVPLTKVVEKEIMNHNYRAAYAGVYPVKQEFEPESMVIDRLIKELSTATKDKTMAIWKQRYCKGDLPLGMNGATEIVMKCRLAEKGKSKKYQSWLKKYFALTSLDDRADFEVLMGFRQT